MQNVGGEWHPTPPCSSVLILFMSLLDLRLSATSKSLVSRVRYVPPSSSPCAFLDLPQSEEAALLYVRTVRVVLLFPVPCQRY